VTAQGRTADDAYPVGVTTITWTATDASGTVSETQTITVTDTETPVLVLPPDRSAFTDPHRAEATLDPGAATATDNCTTGIVISSSRSDGQALNAPYSVGRTQITWRAADGAENHTEGIQSVTVIDNELPKIAVPADILVNAASSAGAIVTYTATASDNVGVGSPLCAPQSGITFAIGTTTVTCSATDAAGNRATAAFRVTVRSTLTFGTLLAQIVLGPSANDDRFAVEAVFTVAAGTNGISPPAEKVILRLGPGQWTIPAGSFRPNGFGGFVFRGSNGLAQLVATIQPLRGGQFGFAAAGSRAELTGAANPLGVALTIGDDVGTTTVTGRLLSAQP